MAEIIGATAVVAEPPQLAVPMDNNAGALG